MVAMIMIFMEGYFLSFCFFHFFCRLLFLFSFFSLFLSLFILWIFFFWICFGLLLLHQFLGGRCCECMLEEGCRMAAAGALCVFIPFEGLVCVRGEMVVCRFNFCVFMLSSYYLFYIHFI